MNNATDKNLNEVLASPERGLESAVERSAESYPIPEAKPLVTRPAPVTIQTNPTQSSKPLSPVAARIKEIENVLEEDLGDLYFQLPPQEQQRFKVEGEKTAQNINNLLSDLKLKVSRVAGLIRGWLQLIPGVNKFFLEQETKIKTDKIVDRFLRR
ncbi:hypothetical protein COT94_03845 [Candidatus Falkowbacteria bacterium CG10_big_fil_rev_8_21_14_0_10_37_14]|uniref:Uncharacterized protein n=1 Tax=Candidatus Falkowbacteria bacterium CG10_big_fil_rev_8_21_14_0_10_37_14 TaxID=1974561 RepID=A0A2M6WSE6_9BACT|nr:hypothetical protein [Candidatus Falkowbacteria bacterium]PIT95694.1 MAG: hypothetical protein COT94_03845 [Candidatus Falkowbacteria bacterium CG10_big_fil_rev_8_21_14_0_10_37_14]